MRRPQYRALLLALLLVVAGCSSIQVDDGDAGSDAPATTAPSAPTTDGPPATTPGSPTATTPGNPTTTTRPTERLTKVDPVDPADVTVEGGELPVDVGRIYARVQALTGLEADPPTVVVEEPRDRPIRQEEDGLLAALGLSGGTADDLNCGTIASASAGSDRVRIVADGLSAAEIELVLVHEFVHVLQRSNDLDPDSDLDGRERLYVETALIEGGAVYVANEYSLRYDLTWKTGDRPLELRRCFYEQAPDGFKTLTGLYYFGGEYFDGVLDDPTEFASAYDRLPNTTEGLLHGEPAGVDPPAALDAEVKSEAWETSRRGTFGELTTRLVLASELEESKAAAAAEGWGNDVAFEFERGDDRGYAWIHVWDEADEAAAFVDAARAYADSRDEGPPIRVVRVDETTTTLLVGDQYFLDSVSVTREGGTVTVAATD